MENRAGPNLAGIALISSVGCTILLRETIRKPCELLQTTETRGNLVTPTARLQEWPTDSRQLPIP
jgi:hypothetical protein